MAPFEGPSPAQRRFGQTTLTIDSFVSPRKELVRLHASLRKALSPPEDLSQALDLLAACEKVPRVNESVLRSSGGIARVVARIGRRHGDERLAAAARSLTQKWRDACLAPAAPSRPLARDARAATDGAAKRVVDCRPDARNLVTQEKLRDFFARPKAGRGATDACGEAEWDDDGP